MRFRDMTKEQLAEESLIDLGFALLEERGEAIPLQQLFQEIQKLTKATDKQMKARSLQFYTDMNIDGRFLAISEGRWGLREWFPVEQIEEETAPTVKVRKKKAKAKVVEEIEDEPEEELLFEEDFDEVADDGDDFEAEDEVLADPDVALLPDEEEQDELLGESEDDELELFGDGLLDDDDSLKDEEEEEGEIEEDEIEEDEIEEDDAERDF